MPTRGQVKVWKPRRSDAWRLCDDVTDGHCSCRLNGTGPCRAWLMPLRHCYAFGLAHNRAQCAGRCNPDSVHD